MPLRNTPMKSEEVFPACQVPEAMGPWSSAARLTRTTPNLVLKPLPNSLHSCCAPASGGADAARRQEAGAASCLALPRYQRRIRRRVTLRTDHHSVDRAPALRCAPGVAGARTLPAPWPAARPKRDGCTAPGLVGVVDFALR